MALWREDLLSVRSKGTYIPRSPRETSAKKDASKLLPVYLEDLTPSIHSLFISRKPQQVYLYTVVMNNVIYKFYFSHFFFGKTAEHTYIKTLYTELKKT